MAGGRLGDIFGHRNVLLFGITLFNIATLVCALVHDKIGLVVGRAFQGIPFMIIVMERRSRLTGIRNRGCGSVQHSFGAVACCAVI